MTHNKSNKNKRILMKNVNYQEIIISSGHYFKDRKPIFTHTRADHIKLSQKEIEIRAEHAANIISDGLNQFMTNQINLKKYQARPSVSEGGN